MTWILLGVMVSTVAFIVADGLIAPIVLRYCVSVESRGDGYVGFLRLMGREFEYYSAHGFLWYRKIDNREASLNVKIALAKCIDRSDDYQCAAKARRAAVYGDDPVLPPEAPGPDPEPDGDI